MLELKDILRNERKRHRFTQAQLSKKLHISRKTISDWENGRSMPSVDVLMNLSNIYGIPINLFLKNRRYNKKITISYYLNIILLLLSYLDLFGIATRIIPILIIINLLILRIGLRNQNKIYFNKKYIINSLLMSLFFMIINTIIIFITHHISKLALGVSSVNQWAILLSAITIVVIRSVSFFYLILFRRLL